jgi:hypothetical protein
MRTIEAAETALTQFDALRAEVEAGMPKTDDPHVPLSGHEQLLERRAKRTLNQIEHGLDPADVTDPRLGDLIRSPLVQGLRVRRPCRTTIAALIEQLRQGAEGQAKPRSTGATWPRLHRLRTQVRIHPRATPAPAGPHVLDGRLVLPGETVLLTEEQSAAFADKFEEVSS